MKNILLPSLALISICATATKATAQDHSNHDHHEHHEHHGMSLHGDHSGHVHSSAPISIMGDHMHKQGEWMTSYRYSRMDMKGNRNGTSNLSPEEVITFNNPNSPPATLRVVPTEMTMDMHMLGAMYGATDWLTLMAMGMYMKNEMDHITFQGMAGTTRLSTFTAKSSGWGDTTLGSMIRLHDDGKHHLHLNASLSLPTGSIKEQDDVLAPTGMTPTLRLPYAMQLGSGTYDLLPGITYTGQQNRWSWGTQYKATIRLEGENDQNYQLGDKHGLTAWAGYQAAPWLQTTASITGERLGEIDGSDPMITAPVQTADPNNYGGKRIDTSVGFNITPDLKDFGGLEIGGEITVPVYQNLNGPQLERDWTATFGISKTF